LQLLQRSLPLLQLLQFLLRQLHLPLLLLLLFLLLLRRRPTLFQVRPRRLPSLCLLLQQRMAVFFVLTTRPLCLLLLVLHLPLRSCPDPEAAAAPHAHQGPHCCCCRRCRRRCRRRRCRQRCCHHCRRNP
jgi:hypothetical protein